MGPPKVAAAIFTVSNQRTKFQIVTANIAVLF